MTPTDHPTGPSPTNLDEKSDHEACSHAQRAGPAFASTTSSSHSNEEPFDIFEPKVLALCRDLWPNLKSREFQVTPMAGGAYNRVIGIEVTKTKAKVRLLQRLFSILAAVAPHSRKRVVKTDSLPYGNYVIRIPRDNINAWMEHEVAIIDYLNAETTIPVPRTVKYDLTSNNGICARYALQPRVPGSPAIESYQNLNVAQKISFATQFGDALRKMGRKSVACPGILDPASLRLSGEPNIVRFYIPALNSLYRFIHPQQRPKEVLSQPSTPYELFRDLCARQLSQDYISNRQIGSPWVPGRLDKIVKIMNEFGLFDDNVHYLTHMDLEPRNILIHVKDSSTANLSAILDWDSAIFAPAFLNCKPPSWLWAWEAYCEEDEAKANDIPKYRDMQKIKEAFEDAAGFQFLRYAYTPEYRLARNIFRLAIQGIETNDGFNEVEDIIKQWDALYPDHAVAVVDGSSDGEESAEEGNYGSEEDENPSGEDDGAAEDKDCKGDNEDSVFDRSLKENREGDDFSEQNNEYRSGINVENGSAACDDRTL